MNHPEKMSSSDMNLFPLEVFQWFLHIKLIICYPRPFVSASGDGLCEQRNISLGGRWKWEQRNKGGEEGQWRNAISFIIFFLRLVIIFYIFPVTNVFSYSYRWVSWGSSKLEKGQISDLIIFINSSREICRCGEDIVLDFCQKGKG